MAKTAIRGGSSTAISQIQDLTIYDLQIATGAGIATTKLAEGNLFIKSTGSVPFTADQPHGTSDTVSASNFKITKLADPVNAQDAATRAWTLSQIAASTAGTTAATAKAATTANITLSATQTVDGVSLAVNDVCLVKNQTTQANNGLYTVQSSAWTRVAGMDTWAEVPGVICSVQQGTTNADTMWLSTADAGGTLGTTNITWVQMPGPSDIIAGAGILRTGQTFDITAADNSMTIGTDTIGVKLDTRAITVAAAGIGINLEGTNPTLQIASNQLGVKLDGARCITTGASGIGVNPDNTTIEANSNALRVKPASIGDTQLSVTYQKQANIVVRETPGGTINGVNATFTLAATPVSGSEQIFLNGVLLESGAGNDYTISTATITMLVIPQTGDRLKANYLK